MDRPALALIATCLALLSACAVAPADQPAPLDVGALTADAWRWRYITAALGGDRTTTLRLSADGGAEQRVRSWVYDHETHTSSHPETITTGSWQREGDDAIRVQLGAHKRLFTPAVLARAPLRLDLEADPPVAVRGGRVLITRALRHQGDGCYRTRYGDSEVYGGHELSVEMVLKGTSNCVQSWRVRGQVQGKAGPAAVDIRIDGLACERRTVDGLTELKTPSLGTVDQRRAAVDDAATTGELPDGKAWLVAEALHGRLYSDAALPGVWVPRFGDWDESGWSAVP